MLVAYWAAKGGAGASVLGAVHALVSSSERTTVLVDLAGDLEVVLGLPEQPAGVADWLRAGADVPADALDRLTVAVRPGLSLLPRGSGPLEPGRAEVLARILAADHRVVVVDAGTGPGPCARPVLRQADRSILVTRACYLALRRATRSPQAPTEAIVVREPGRALGVADVAAALGVPVRAAVPVDPHLARAVDAGLLAGRLPRAIERVISPIVGRATVPS